MEAAAAAGERFGARLAEDLDPPDIRLILEVFRADVGRLGGVLRDSAAAADMARFRRAAHSLAGAAAAVGAATLEQACRRAMAMAEVGAEADSPPARLPAEAAEIAAQCDAALADATAYLSGLDGG
jgi:HPt (histidine-containing phosphotransfer) domain-containing protein